MKIYFQWPLDKFLKIIFKFIRDLPVAVDVDADVVAVPVGSGHGQDLDVQIRRGHGSHPAQNADAFFHVAALLSAIPVP